MITKEDKKVKKLYLEACNYLEPFIEYNTLKKIAIYNKGYDPDNFDFINYLKKSYLRYKNILQNNFNKEIIWLDVGALFPAFPITLAKLGLKVFVIEDYSYYPIEIQDMYKDISGKFGITFIDNNFTSNIIDIGKKFDYISIMGVIEHLPYTPKILLSNVYNNLNKEGKVFLDTPNFFYVKNIVNFLCGKHIQVPIELFYNSEIPFVGHHREYNIEDLKYIFMQSNFHINRIETYNYSPEFNYRNLFSFVGLITNLLIINPYYKEVIFIEGEKL